jgi:exonuclease SbcD
VRLDRPEPALRRKVEAALEGKHARLVRLGTELVGADARTAAELRPIAELSPVDVFRRKYGRDFPAATEPPPDLLLAFEELHQLVLEDPA